MLVHRAASRGFALAVFTNHRYGAVLERPGRWRRPTRRIWASASPSSRRSSSIRRRTSGATRPDGRHRARRDGRQGLELRFIPKGGFPTPETPAGPAPPPAVVRFASEDELFAVDDLWKGERVRFLRDEDGEIKWLRAGGRVFAPVDG